MGYLHRYVASAGTQNENIFLQQTYNGFGNVAFFALVPLPRINRLRAVNTLDRSTPAASITISFNISCLQMRFNFVQCHFAEADSPPGFSHGACAGTAVRQPTSAYFRDDHEILGIRMEPP